MLWGLSQNLEPSSNHKFLIFLFCTKRGWWSSSQFTYNSYIGNIPIQYNPEICKNRKLDRSVTHISNLNWNKNHCDQLCTRKWEDNLKISRKSLEMELFETGTKQHKTWRKREDWTLFTIPFFLFSWDCPKDCIAPLNVPHSCCKLLPEVFLLQPLWFLSLCCHCQASNQLTL